MADWGYPGLRRHGCPVDPCDGCHECGLRCTAGVQMTRQEFDRIVEHLRTLDLRQAIRVLEQDKRRVLFEEINYEACPFYDVTQRRCIVYPARALICRLFGRVEWLPCPIGKPVPQVRNGIELIRSYAEQPRNTFPEWCAKLGMYDFRQLLAASD